MADSAPGKHFKISSALKTLIGRDLITNPNVAVFELVKNAYDAGARRVDVVFERDRLVIADNGSGMSPEDIRDKWLFVAYSGKKGERDQRGHAYAGSKGVGRFAADQLGERLRLQSRAQSRAPIHQLGVDWSRFDRSQDEHFINIPVRRTIVPRFDVPEGIAPPKKGTVVIIERLRNEWTREKLVRLREYLTRLVDPFGDAAKGFQIVICAPDEAAADRREKKRARAEARPPVDIVNGVVKSNLIDALTEGTTSIEVHLSPDGRSLDTKLVDRGTTVYRIREPNTFAHLRDSGFDCRLFYLRTAAKASFKRRMGRSSVEYGSVFLFRNGFRVFPIGEEGNDFFEIDRRKQQGYMRYLGTRDIIGRINVTGPDTAFRETTSRDGGLIQTPALAELKDAFFRSFRRLESFVVNVTWPDKLDQDELEPNRMQAVDAKTRMVHLLAGLAEATNVQLLEVAPNLDELLAERLDQQEPTMRALESIAKNRQDDDLLRAVGVAKARFKKIIVERQRAESRAENERAGRDSAEARLRVVAGALADEKKRNLFLVAATPLDVQALQGFLHQIGLQATDVSTLADNALRALARPDLEIADLRRFLERISWRAQQTLAVTKFATRANFRLDTAHVTEDLSQFLQEYIERVAVVWQDRIAVRVAADGVPVRRMFRPIDMSIVVDNLISNARRADASEIRFEIAANAKGKGLTVWVSDDGKGLSLTIERPEDIFERGVTTTHGSGLGLWHVKHAVVESGGQVRASIDDRRRLTFCVSFPE